MTEFVTDPASLTPEWLSGVLGERVSSVTVSEVTGGVIARTVRVRLGYTGAAPGAPRSLVAKFPAEAELPRMLAKGAGLYTREVLFYRELAPRVGMRVPRCHFGRVDEAGERFALLLEDVTDATMHDQDEAWAREDVLLALGQLALLHGAHWDDSRLASLGWLNSLSGERLEAWEQLFRVAWQDFTARAEVELDPGLFALGERFCAAGFDSWTEGFQGPRSLVHADFHTGNLLFRTREDGAREVVTVDWQLVTYASPLIDVAYLLGRMPTAVRRAGERDLVRAYHAALAADYPWDRCWEDYQRWVWYGVVSALIAVLGTPMSAKEAALYCDKVTRYLTQAADHDSVRFVS
ncbi:phosphotransferase [Amycolatopsis samaneae]|uniref:Phosphotransferase n=1 Tax=Amycolatopsis samaneae TaxID=664691 RepID=A0ABW5GWG3_9PSEU